MCDVDTVALILFGVAVISSLVAVQLSQRHSDILAAIKRLDRKVGKLMADAADINADLVEIEADVAAVREDIDAIEQKITDLEAFSAGGMTSDEEAAVATRISTLKQTVADVKARLDADAGP